MALYRKMIIQMLGIRSHMIRGLPHGVGATVMGRVNPPIYGIDIP